MTRIVIEPLKLLLRRPVNMPTAGIELDLTAFLANIHRIAKQMLLGGRSLSTSEGKKESNTLRSAKCLLIRARLHQSPPFLYFSVLNTTDTFRLGCYSGPTRRIFTLQKR